MVRSFAVSSPALAQTARRAGAFLFFPIRPPGGCILVFLDALGAEPLLASLTPAFAFVTLVPEE
jgi:hypothetical protein